MSVRPLRVIFIVDEDGVKTIDETLRIFNSDVEISRVVVANRLKVISEPCDVIRLACKET